MHVTQCFMKETRLKNAAKPTSERLIHCVQTFSAHGTEVQCVTLATQNDLPSNLSEGTALSMEGGTEVCSFLNFSNAFLLISSFCSGSEDETQQSAYQPIKSHFHSQSQTGG